MSLIETFYNKTMSVKKKATITGSKTTGYEAVASGISCVVMPITEMDRLYNRSDMGKEFEIVCGIETEIKDGYILTIDSKEYGVAGVSRYEDYFEDIDSYYKIRGVRK